MVVEGLAESLEDAPLLLRQAVAQVSLLGVAQEFVDEGGCGALPLGVLEHGEAHGGLVGSRDGEIVGEESLAHVVVLSSPGPVGVGVSVDGSVVVHPEGQDAADEIVVPELVAEVVDEGAEMGRRLGAAVGAAVVLREHVDVVEDYALHAQLLCHLKCRPTQEQDDDARGGIGSTWKAAFMMRPLLKRSCPYCSVTMKRKSSSWRMRTGMRKSRSRLRWDCRSR